MRSGSKHSKENEVPDKNVFNEPTVEESLSQFEAEQRRINIH